MNIKNSTFLELTDAELTNVCGGFTIHFNHNFNPEQNSQTNGFADSSFHNAYFGELSSAPTGGFQVGGNATNGGNFYNNGFYGPLLP